MDSPTPLGRAVMISGVFVLLMVCIGAFMLEMTVASSYQTQYVSDQPTQYKETKTFSSSNNVFAIVKGSIYETGSNMTVFGACQDGNGYLLPTATATFTAWYPNGSVMLGPNASMTSVLTNGSPSGRVLIHVTMPDTVGTYFTEMRCDYNGEYALANGEWQNPEWVTRIRTIDGNVVNMSQVLQNMSMSVENHYASTQSNLSTIMSQLAGLNATNGMASPEELSKISDVYRAVVRSTGNIWVMDASNPSYVPFSSMNEWRAVDMGTGDNVCMAGSKGEWQCLRDTTWTYGNVSGAVWAGVATSKDSNYFVLVGTNLAGTQSELSFNGGAKQEISNDSKFFDAKIVNDPFDPSQLMKIYVLGSNHIYSTSDMGATWVSEGCMNASEMVCTTGVQFAKMSNIHYKDQYKYTYAYVDDVGKLTYFNGTSFKTYGVANAVGRGVTMVNATHGYAVFSTLAENQVYSFDESTGLQKEFEWVGATSIPMGIAAATDNDIWVSTTNPDSLYHYNGLEWVHQSTVGSYSSNGSVYIDFFNNYTISGVSIGGISMSDEFRGYVVGSDGLVMKYMSNSDKKMENLLLQVAKLNLSGGNVNLSQILALNESIYATYNNTYALLNNTYTLVNGTYVLLNNTNAMVNSTYALVNGTYVLLNETYTSINTSLNGIYVLLNNTYVLLNATNVLANGSYVMANATYNLVNATYLATSVHLDQLNNSIAQVYFLVNETRNDVNASYFATSAKLDQLNASLYTVQSNILGNMTYLQMYMNGTLEPMLNDILIKLGMLQATANQTLAISNQTLNVVNQTDQKVDILINQSKRPRVWTTQ
jgi:hypothetical protein